MLLLTFVLVGLVLFALFWGGTLLAHGYFYQQPAGRLPARAAAAAVLVAGFLTFWVWLDKRSPGKYDTFFEFSGYTTTAFDEFEAVRWTADPAAPRGKVAFKADAQGKPVEKMAKFKRAGGKAGAFAEEGAGKAFLLSDGDVMTVAVVVKAGDGPPTRFNAVLREDPRTGAKTYPPKGDDRRRFEEEKGSRYVALDEPGKVYVPSSGVVFLALLINVLLFVVWFAAFWPILQFTWGHAVVLAGVFGLVTMLLAMPMLFRPNRVPQPAPEPAAQAAAERAIGTHPVPGEV